MNEPFVFVAVVGTSFVEADDNLSDLLRAVRGLHDTDTGEDVVIWHELKRIAAIVHHDGTETIFEPTKPARNFSAKYAKSK
jgi:hypothetical protein